MIEDVRYPELVRPGHAELISTAVAGAKCYALEITTGHVLIRAGQALPVIGNKTATRDFGEWLPDKYDLSQPVQEIGEIASAVVVPGSANYYHFLATSLPAYVFLKHAPGARVTLAVAHDVPLSGAALIPKLLPAFAGDRPVDVVKLAPGDYRARDVIVRCPPMMPFSVAVGRVVQEIVLSLRGIKDAARDLGGLKLFVRRDGKVSGRRLVNQPEIEQWFVRRGYESVDPGALSMEDQIVLFARATHIAGVEGAGLTNLLFAANTRELVILASPLTLHDRFFAPMASCVGIPLTTIYGEVVGSDPANRWSDFALPLDRLETAMHAAAV